MNDFIAKQICKDVNQWKTSGRSEGRLVDSKVRSRCVHWIRGLPASASRGRTLSSITSLKHTLSSTARNILSCWKSFSAWPPPNLPQCANRSEGISAVMEGDRRLYSNTPLLHIDPDSKTCLIQQNKITHWHDVRKVFFCANYWYSGVSSYRELPYAGYILQDFITDFVPDVALPTLGNKALDFWIVLRCFCPDYPVSSGILMLYFTPSNLILATLCQSPKY